LYSLHSGESPYAVGRPDRQVSSAALWSGTEPPGGTRHHNLNIIYF